VSGARIHRPEAMACWAIDRALLAALAPRLERRMAFSLSVSDRELLLAFDSETLGGTVASLTLA
jgi:hypothetical protein